MAKIRRDTLRARSREARAVKLRLQGATYAEIAEVLGYADHSGAYLAIERSLLRFAAESKDDVRQLREPEDARLDALWDAVKPAALAGEPKAVALGLAISDRRRRLHGLDAPHAVEIGMSDQLRDLFATVQAERNAPLPVESYALPPAGFEEDGAMEWEVEPPETDDA